MINDDWIVHKLELNTTTGILLVDGKNSLDVTYKIAQNNVGIWFYTKFNVDNFNWNFNHFNEDQIYYTATVSDYEIYIPHDFNKYPLDTVIGSTYTIDSHYHFIVDLLPAN